MTKSDPDRPLFARLWRELATGVFLLVGFLSLIAVIGSSLETVLVGWGTGIVCIVIGILRMFGVIKDAD